MWWQRAREKGGNGARYGEMARKLGIVTGNGRRSTPLTERKLEPEEIVGGQPRDLSLRAPRTRPADTARKEDKGGNELEYLTNGKSRKGDEGKEARRPCERARKEKGTGMKGERKGERGISSLLSTGPFLYLSFPFPPLLELRAENVRGIELTSPTC